MAELETPIGIIIPPIDIRNIVDKTAQFVSRNGPEFEVRIRKNEAQNVKFNFLKDDDPYNSYYRHRVAAFKSGVAQKEAKEKAETEKEQLKKENEKTLKESDIRVDELGNQIGGAKQAFTSKEPPEKYEFISEPPTIVARELDMIKMTAQFIAKNGKSFLSELMHSQAKNYHFDFLRPQHSCHPFFMQMIEQYTKILIPSNSLLNKIKRDSHHQNASLIDYKKDCQARIDWTKQQRAAKDKEEAEIEKDKKQYDQIDWNDFVIVETVDYQQTESLSATDTFPAPVSVEELGKRLTQQLRYEEFGEDGIRQQLEDEKAIAEAEENRRKEVEEARLMQEQAEEEAERMALEEKQHEEMMLLEQEQSELEAKIADLQKQERKAKKFERRRLREQGHVFKRPDLPGAAGDVDIFMSESDDDDDDEEEEEEEQLPSFIPEDKAEFVIRDYDPKKDQKKKWSTADAEKWLTSPLTGEKIRADKMDEHMRHGLLDPQWKETKKRQILDQQHSGGIYAHNKEIGDQLLKVAQRRTDIFGVEETGIGKKITESDKDELKRQEAIKTWDGHAGSAEIVTARAKKITVIAQLQELKKTNQAMGGEAFGKTSGSDRAGPNFSDIVSSDEEEGIRSMAAQPGPKTIPIYPAGEDGQAPPPPPKQQIILSQMQEQQIFDKTVPVEQTTSQVLQRTIFDMPRGHFTPELSKPLDEKVAEMGGVQALKDEIEGKTGDIFSGGSETRKEAHYSGLTMPNKETPGGPEAKRPKMDATLLDQEDFIYKYCSTGIFVEYTVKCPVYDQWALKGQELTITMNVKHTFTQLKKKLEELLTMPMPKMKLQYDGKFVKDNTTFAENNCIPGKTIHLSVKQRGGRR